MAKFIVEGSSDGEKYIYNPDSPTGKFAGVMVNKEGVVEGVISCEYMTKAQVAKMDTDYNNRVFRGEQEPLKHAKAQVAWVSDDHPERPGHGDADRGDTSGAGARLVMERVNGFRIPEFLQRNPDIDTELANILKNEVKARFKGGDVTQVRPSAPRKGQGFDESR